MVKSQTETKRNYYTCWSMYICISRLQIIYQSHGYTTTTFIFNHVQGSLIDL